MPRYKYAFALILIIALAAFFRFWNFDSAPPGLYQDEAMNGANALASIESGSAQGGPSSGWKVFYSDNNGREGMIVWLDALAIKAFGTAPWVLRLFPALAGILAVWGLYFLAKELFNREIALVSAFFMATGFWAVNLSRIGFRAGLMLPFLIWSMYFLYRGFKKILRSPTSEVRLRDPQKSDFNAKVGLRLEFIIAGILFGLGFYTYIPFRFAPFLAFAFLPFLFKKGAGKLWIGVGLFAAAALIVFLPLGLYFLDNLGDFFGRSGQVAIWSAESPLKAAALSIGSALGMFNIVGDFNWRHNYRGLPQLFWPVGILFLLGIIISVKRLAFSERFMLAWLAIFLLPNILSTEGNPHALRAIGAIPPAMIFAGIGLVWLYKKIQGYLDANLRIKKEVFWLLIVFLVFTAGLEFNKYNRWAAHPKVFDAFAGNQVELADYLNGLSADIKKYALWHPDDRTTDNGLPVSAQTVYFLTAEKTNVNYLKADELDKIELGGRGTVIAPIYSDTDLLHNLQKKYPGSRIEIVGLNIGAVIVPYK